MPWKMSWVGIFCLGLCACSATIPAPIHNESTGLQVVQGYYTVLPGDTLYSIAWETGHDYRELAAWNAITPPYRIVVGERLRLTAPTRTHHRLIATIVHPLGRQTPDVAHASPVLPPRIVPRTARRVAPILSSISLPKIIHTWIWPVHGSIASPYGGPSDNKGIDIAGNYGEPIRAAAAGLIVYVGSGLPGYGKLIIIKHNNNYLSAYAHNAKVEEKEGSTVRQGQVIATMGDSGTDRVELLFEIRKHGVPVNPLHYLPRNHH